MRRFMAIFFSLLIGFSLWGCVSREPYQQIDLTADQLQKKLDQKESFLLMVERENCPFCEKLDAYKEKTKEEHFNVTVYRLDSTDFKLEQQEDGTLSSQTEGGKTLLTMAPYFFYTPTLYVIRDGKVIQSGVGFNESTGQIALWSDASVVAFDEAEYEEFWDFVEKYSQS